MRDSLTTDPHVGKRATIGRRAALLVVAVAALLYTPTLWHGFVFDDSVEVVRNEHIRSLAHVPTILRSTAWAGAGLDNHLYRPLTTLTYSMNHLLGGLVPWGYHLANVALHALVVLLLFRLAVSWGLGVPGATVAALLFAVHPLHVEAVANVAGRKELLMTVLVLGMLLCHRRALARPGLWTAAAVLSYLGAALSKETGVVAAALAAWQDIVPPRGEGKEGARSGRGVPTALLYGGYALVLGAYLSVRFSVVGGFGVARIPFQDNPAAHAGTLERLLTATGAVGRGLWLHLWPATLSPDYSYDAIPVIRSAADPAVLATLAVLLLLLIVAVRARRTEPILPLSVGWYAAALLPASNLLFPIGTLFAERLLYLPSVAVCMVAGCLAQRLATRLGSRPVVVLLSVVLLLMAGRSALYTAAWRSPLSLYQHAGRVVPDSAKVQYNLGTELGKAGRYPEALAALERSIALRPEWSEAHNQIGNVRLMTGQTEKAVKAYREALRLDPRNVTARYNLARQLDRIGEREGAARHYERFLAEAPRGCAGAKARARERLSALRANDPAGESP